MHYPNTIADPRAGVDSKNPLQDTTGDLSYGHDCREDDRALTSR